MESHNDDKEKFVVQLVQVLWRNDKPFVIGGDLNIIKIWSDSNKRSGLSKWFIFCNE